jgi:ribosome-associated heat shock protein Hsp15
VKQNAPARPPAPTAVRIDKWLWAARFFKTRALAQQAVESGHVKLNGDRVKPARPLKPGDRLDIHIGGYAWIITVQALSDQRGPAPTARLLYAESEDSRLKREKEVAEHRAQINPSAALHGRPTKRDRRRLDLLTDRD